MFLIQPGATSMQSLGQNQVLALPAEGTAAGIRADAQAETALITPPTSSQRGNDALDTVAEVDDSSHAPFVARVQRMDAQPEFAAVDGERVVGGRMYPDALQARMEAEIPLVEDDIVVMYAAVEGTDAQGHRRRLDRGIVVRPVATPNGRMRAIQATTAAGLAESAKALLSGRHRGVVLQMDLDPEAFLNGAFVGRVYR